MNRRILIALIARADLDDAKALDAISKESKDREVRLAGNRALYDAQQMHSSILQSLGGTEKEHYDKVEQAVFAKFEPVGEVPKCDFDGCMNPVVKVCKCSRCEIEGNHHEDRFYTCADYHHLGKAIDSHRRMRQRECIWSPL